MPSSWSVLDIPFSNGVNQKPEPEVLPELSFAVLQNAHQTRTGSFQKRNGNTVLTSNIIGGVLGGTITSGGRIFPFRDAPCVIGNAGTNGTWLFNYDPNATIHQYIDRVPEPLPSRYSAAGLGLTPGAYDVTYVNGFQVVAWRVADTVGGAETGYIRVINLATGNTVIQDKNFAVAGNPIFKLLTLGNAAFLVFTNSSTANTLFLTKLDTSNATNLASGWTAPVTLPNAIDLSAHGWLWDACTGGTSHFYVAYVNTTTGDDHQITVRAYNSSGTNTDASNRNFAANGVTAIGIGGTESDTIWVANADLTTVTVEGYTPSNLAVSSATAATVITLPANSGYHIGVVRTGAATGHVMVAGGTSGTSLYWRNFSVSGGAVTPSVAAASSAFRTYPVSRQFVVNGRVYCHAMLVDAGAATANQNMTSLVDLTVASADLSNVPRPVAFPAAHLSVAPKLSIISNALTTAGGLSHVAMSDANHAMLPIVVKKSTAAGGVLGGSASAIDFCTYDFTVGSQWQVANLKEATCYGGGAAYFYDGRATAEVGFFGAPDTPTLALAAFVGGLTAGTTYQYVAIYEQIDSTGCVHWSQASNFASIAPTGGNTQVNVTLHTLQVSQRKANGQQVRLVLYRKAGNGVFQRIPNSETLNSFGQDTFVYNDTNTDNAISAQPVLYTETGAQARQTPPCLPILITHEDRLVGIDETRVNVFYSGQYVYGEAPWFSSSFQFPIDQGGPLTALGSMNGRLYCFKRDRIFYVDGDGPPDAGGAGFSLPQEIPCGGSGCIEPRSVVTTDRGIFYQSDRGIFLLTAGHELKFIGAPLEQSTLGLTVTSAVNHSELGLVYFQTFPSAHTADWLVYDLLHGTWSTDAAFMGTTSGGVVSTSLIGGSLSGTPLYYMLTGDGFILQENTASGLDGAYWQPTIIETAWIRMGQQQGYQRIRDLHLIAKQLSGHDLTFTMSYDYADSTTDIFTFTAADIAAFTSNREQIAVELKTQKVESFKVRIADNTPSSGSLGSCFGAVFFGLSVEAKSKGGTYRLPPNQSR